MTDVNGITGARLVSKVPTEEYKTNYDKIFNKKKETLIDTSEYGMSTSELKVDEKENDAPYTGGV